MLNQTTQNCVASKVPALLLFSQLIIVVVLSRVDDRDPSKLGKFGSGSKAKEVLLKEILLKDKQEKSY